MYSIIGGDQKTYGPVTVEEVHRWIREGRADERTRVKEEGAADWQALGSLPEFFPQPNLHPPTLTSSLATLSLPVSGVLRIGECFGQGWQVYRQDPWRMTGIIGLVFLAQFILNSIPVLGALLAFLLNGPILGGVYYFCFKNIQGRSRGMVEITETVKGRFLPCFLATTVSSLLALAPLLLACIPAAALFSSSGIVLEEIAKHPSLLLGMGIPLLAGLLGMFYLFLGWSFAVPIAACSASDFWFAMKVSWHGVRNNFWSYIGLLLLLGGINLLGLLCLFVGLFVTIPFTFLVTMVAYGQIFRTSHPRET